MIRHFVILAVSVALAPTLTSAADGATSSSVVETISAEDSSQLAAEWWQWAESVPSGHSPIQDEKGVDCAQDQQGPVWFLAGGYGSSQIHRVCTVPAGKTLFFPVVNMVYFPNQNSVSGQFTCEQADFYGALSTATALDLFASVDGVEIDDLKQYRVSTPKCFDIFARIPQDQQPYSGFPSATDGYWLLLKPLSKGHHVLKFGGRYNNSTPYYGHMVQDIEYDLVVE